MTAAPRPAHPARRGMPFQALFNRFVKLLLRSPAHRLLSGNPMLLTFTGRRSGVRRTVPITYLQEGGGVSCFCNADVAWWKNLRGGAPVELRLRGRIRTGTAVPVRMRPRRRSSTGAPPRRFFHQATSALQKQLTPPPSWR